MALLAKKRMGRSERVSATLALAAVGTAGTVVAGQFARMLRRRTVEAEIDWARPALEGTAILEAMPSAATDAVGVAVEGYSAAPRSETVLFNLLVGFVGAFAGGRLTTWGIREGWWPLRDTRIAGKHIHHFVPGILLAFGAGTAGLLADAARTEERLALPLGVGMGLTFDEAALLLDLRDVYWSPEGVLSVQLSLGLAATGATTLLALRMLRRGEQLQEAAGVIPPPPDRFFAMPPEED